MAEQDLRQQFAIVDEEGKPTTYFMRFFQDTKTSLTGSIDDAAAALLAAQAAQAAADAVQAQLDALVLNDITDVDTSGVSDGDVLTYNSSSGNWEASAASGGGSGWTELYSWDFGTDGSLTSVDISVDGYETVKIFGQVTTSVSAQLLLRASVDSGSTFYTTSGDYYTVHETFGFDQSAVTDWNDSGTASSASRYFVINIEGLTMSNPVAWNSMLERETKQARRFVASTSLVDTIRILSSSGNFSAGSFKVLAQ